MPGDVSRESASEGQLDLYHELLVRRAVPYGFVSESDLPRLRERHIEDSLRALDAFRPEDALVYDLGSGAGLPGIPLAIQRPEAFFVLAETRSKRVAFLELAVEELGLRNVRIHHGRAEELPGGADLVTARAFAPLERTWPVAAGLLGQGGRLVYFAGDGLDHPGDRARQAAASAGVGASVSLIVDSGSPLVIMELT